VTAEVTPRPAQDVADELLHGIKQEREAVMRGDELATARQHAKGKATARERLDRLLDEGSFVELDLFRRGDGTARTDGVVTGSGTVCGRRVFVYAQDFGILGGSLGKAHAEKIHKVMDLALAAGAPLIALNDSGGARIQEGVTALAGYGGIFRRNVRASGVIPQISVILGPCAGGAAYSPALTDFTFMVRGTSYMFITGPDVVKAVTGESITHEDLGGARVHARQSGVATFTYDDEASCLQGVRYLVSLLPASSHDVPAAVAADDAPDRKCPRLLDIVPASPRKAVSVSNPFISGIDTSSSTRSGFFLRAISNAWTPSCAMSHSKLKCLRIVEIITTVVASSSARTTRRAPFRTGTGTATARVSANLRMRYALSNNSSGWNGRSMKSRLRSATAGNRSTSSSAVPMMTAGLRLRAIISMGGGCSPMAAAEALMKHASKGANVLSPGIAGAAPTTCPIPRTVPNAPMIGSLSRSSKPIKANRLPARAC